MWGYRSQGTTGLLALNTDKQVLEIPVFEASLVHWEHMEPSCHPPLLLNKSQATSKPQLCEGRARIPL